MFWSAQNQDIGDEANIARCDNSTIIPRFSNDLPLRPPVEIGVFSPYR